MQAKSAALAPRPIFTLAAPLLTANMVIPAAIGTDINCGMRLITTGMQLQEVLPRQQELKQAL